MLHHEAMDGCREQLTTVRWEQQRDIVEEPLEAHVVVEDDRGEHLVGSYLPCGARMRDMRRLNRAEVVLPWTQHARQITIPS